jgi:chromate reductase, NAD(P)H dehydrogenase (quinone)
MTSPQLLFIAGSAREASYNRRLARAGAATAQEAGIAATFADLGDYPLPLYDHDEQERIGIPDNAQKLAHLMAVHDGIFIAGPEYNASLTPLLKNTLDWVSRIRTPGPEPVTVFKTRVFGLGSATPGGSGGLRGLIALRQVLEMGLGALVLPDQLLLPRAASAFDADGQLADPVNAARLKALVEKLARAARVLHG